MVPGISDMHRYLDVASTGGFSDQAACMEAERRCVLEMVEP